MRRRPGLIEDLSAEAVTVGVTTALSRMFDTERKIITTLSAENWPKWSTMRMRVKTTQQA